MVGHYSHGGNIDIENGGQADGIVFELLATMFEGAAGSGVIAAEKSPSDATRNAMVERSRFERDLLLARLGHRIRPHQYICLKFAKALREGV